MLTKAIRWRLFFPEPEKVRLRGLHEALYIGYMANTVLPLRAGEVVRAFVAAETEKVSKSTTLATVLIEKVLDLGTMALLLFLLGLIFPDLPDSARYAAYVSGVGLVIAVGGDRVRAGGAGAGDPAGGRGSRSASRRSKSIGVSGPAQRVPGRSGVRAETR